MLFHLPFKWHQIRNCHRDLYILVNKFNKTLSIFLSSKKVHPISKSFTKNEYLGSKRLVSVKQNPLKNSEGLWFGAGSNRRHKDFQSFALPTELPNHFA